MLWLKKRPAEPADWRETVEPLEARTAAWARGELVLAQGEDLFEDVWKRHKVLFSRHQHMKCGYCELKIGDDADGGDIDHHRPKAVVTALYEDPETWGEETPGHNSRDPRKPRKFREVCRGYHWLAYRFDNYVLTCGTCNRKWKGSLFPIAGGHLTAPTVESRATEEPLLLDPYGNVNPGGHLSFDENGIVTARSESEIGRETIRTYHLARESLRESRALFAGWRSAAATS
jgi:hypothetical protein